MNKRILVALAIVGLPAMTVAMSACGNGASASSAQTANAGRPSPGSGAPGGMTDAFDAALSGLVDKGTITDAQKDAVLDKLASAAQQAPPGGAQGAAPSPGATPPARQSGAQPGTGPDFSTALDDLVADGTITADQQQVIVAALQSALPQGGPPAGAARGAATPTVAPNGV
jgi:hypothetical protein